MHGMPPKYPILMESQEANYSIQKNLLRNKEYKQSNLKNKRAEI